MKGILFKEPLYNKIVSGEKTQTRRFISPQPVIDENSGYTFTKDFTRQHDIHNWQELILEECRYKKDEILYLKEPYYESLSGRYIYKFDPENKEIRDLPGLWKNKMFMPEEAARRFIKVTDIRVERIGDISEDDAIAEGIDCMDAPTGGDDYQDYWRDYSKPDKPELWPWFTGDPIKSFKSLWNSINGKLQKDPKTGIYYRFPFDGDSADITIDGKRCVTIANPWVFTYTFELCEL